MEITVDIGKHVVTQLNNLALIEKSNLENITLKMIDLGLRVHLASLEDKAGPVEDPLLKEVLFHVLNTQYLMEETLGHVFAKERSLLKTFDALTALSTAKHMAKSFVQGRNEI